MLAVLYAATLFTSAYLLFSVQPMIARLVLPWFGGGAGVWGVCLVFFQSTLVLGYLYAHASVRWLGRRNQLRVHLALLLASLAWLPIAPAQLGLSQSAAAPSLRLLALLATSVAGPAVLLSSSAPLLQSWMSTRTHRSAFRLYAISNLGSLLGLLCYPFLIEPWLGLGQQELAWSGFYLAFLALSSACLWHSRGMLLAPQSAPPWQGPLATRVDRLLWLALSCCGVLLFLSVGNQLTVSILPLPLLWVLPLALYLGTYVWCFAKPGVYRRRLWGGLFSACVLPTLFLSGMPLVLGIPLAVAVSCLGISAGCMVCHGELAALKPQESELTSFYLHVSIGGVLGSALISFVAPLVFSRYWELPIALFGCLALLGLCRARAALLQERSHASPFPETSTRETTRGQSVWRWMAVGAWLLVCTGLALLCSYPLRQEAGTIAADRSFYGRLQVVESGLGSERKRSLLHGRIMHGQEFMAEERVLEPTLYYAPTSGVALAFHLLPKESRRVGVIGLGVGTLAAFGRAGDLIRFYEIDPMVISMAREYFRFLRSSKAQTEVVLGDARLALQQEARAGGMDYELLVVDAFSSDAIPVHLLTREAFALYWQHLRGDGVLAVNVSNSFLDLAPLVCALGRESGKTCRHVLVEASAGAPSGSAWLLLSSGRAFIEDAALLAAQHALPSENWSGTVWTDERSNLYQLLK